MALQDNTPTQIEYSILYTTCFTFDWQRYFPAWVGYCADVARIFSQPRPVEKRQAGLIRGDEYENDENFIFLLGSSVLHCRTASFLLDHSIFKSN